MRTPVYVTLDCFTHTWNVMTNDNVCVCYRATPEEIDAWLEEHTEYEEV